MTMKSTLYAEQLAEGADGDEYKMSGICDPKGLCIECQQPFKFGVNVFTKEGLAETRITGMCEKCFDALFEEDDDEWL